jgi:branched-chain amino acid transport system permease protein
MFVKFIDPNIAFGIDVSVQIVLICIVGGIGTILGPVVGAAVLVPLSEVLRNPRGLVQVGLASSDSGVVRFIETYLANAHLLVYGVLVVVVILFAPEGVVGVIKRIAARSRRRRAAGAAASPA